MLRLRVHPYALGPWCPDTPMPPIIHALKEFLINQGNFKAKLYNFKNFTDMDKSTKTQRKHTYLTGTTLKRLFPSM